MSLGERAPAEHPKVGKGKGRGKGRSKGRGNRGKGQGIRLPLSEESHMRVQFSQQRWDNLPPDVDPTMQQLSIMTWNISKCLPAAAARPSDASREDIIRASGVHAQLLAVTIAREDPDIIAVQEGPRPGWSKHILPEYIEVGSCLSHCGSVQLLVHIRWNDSVRQVMIHGDPDEYDTDETDGTSSESSEMVCEHSWVSMVPHPFKVPLLVPEGAESRNDGRTCDRCNGTICCAPWVRCRKSCDYDLCMACASHTTCIQEQVDQEFGFAVTAIIELNTSRVAVTSVHLAPFWDNYHKREQQLHSILSSVELPDIKILVGDTDMRDKENHTVAAMGLADAYHSFGSPRECRFTFDLLTNNYLRSKPPNKQEQKKLQHKRFRYDRVLLHQRVGVQRREDQGLHVTDFKAIGTVPEQGHYLSDHFGIYCSLRICQLRKHNCKSKQMQKECRSCNPHDNHPKMYFGLSRNPHVYHPGDLQECHFNLHKQKIAEFIVTPQVHIKEFG